MPIPAAILALIQAGRIAAPLAARTIAGTTAAGLQRVRKAPGVIIGRARRGEDWLWVQKAMARDKIKSDPTHPLYKAPRFTDMQKMAASVIPGAILIPEMQKDKAWRAGLEEAKKYKHGIWGLHDPELKHYPPRTTRGLKRGFHQ